MNMKPKNGPKYIQIRDLLVDHFKKEEYKSGQKLPTEFELKDELGVSRTTIRQALSLLEEEGIIVKKHGSGTYYAGHERKQDNTGASNKGLIGLVNFFFMDYIYPDIIRGIEDTITEYGYNLVLANCNNQTDMEIETVRRLIKQGIRGLILEPSHNLQITQDHPMLNFIKNLDIPVVTTHWGMGNHKLSTVTVDDTQAGYDATRYLIDRGHTKISYIYKHDVQAGYLRYQGFLRAMKEAGNTINPSFILSYDNEEEYKDLRQGYILTKKVLEQPEKPTAIFYFNDHLAQQGYNAITEAALKIPEDLSVIGFDNYHSTEMMHPPLTTFEHPKYNLGRWAARILIDKLEKKTDMPVKIAFEPVLIERESVCTLN